MNRLILIGNGFDLAHNMKTRYYDFILQYLRDCFSEARAKNQYNDELLHIQRQRLSQKQIEDYTFEDLLRFRQKNAGLGGALSHLTGSGSGRYQTPEYPYKLKVNSPFLDHLLDHCGQYNWVDIENAYYEHLTKLIAQKDVHEKLNSLNVAFNYIIERLKTYLMNQKADRLIDAIPRIFTEHIRKEDLVTVKLTDDITPINSLIVNFNYTDTVNQYLSESNQELFDKKIPIVHIHGRLADPANPIIFGFGDELDGTYKLLEADKRRGFLNFIKSFWYFKTSNYHDLIRFIESGFFQVYTLGHSCGLSDRTMLNMIFEHSNCKSIKIFPHEHNGHNNYSELTQEISRHFKDKAIMRMKIVSFDKSTAMPQVSSI